MLRAWQTVDGANVRDLAMEIVSYLLNVCNNASSTYSGCPSPTDSEVKRKVGALTPFDAIVDVIWLCDGL